MKGPDTDAMLHEYQVVWNRRGWKPKLPPELDEDDRTLVGPICERYVDEMRMSPPAGQIWVNDRVAQIRMRSKALQLNHAIDVGFKIPETIISNDPAAIRSFVGRPGSFIVKALAPMFWSEGDVTVSLPTTRVSPSDLSDDVAVQSCPMIYQRLIKKAYEFRVVVLGNRTIWVKLHSQEAGNYLDDWRVAPSLLKAEIASAPSGAEDKIVSFCRSANLLHASFDLAVEPDGSLVFFEVNEQGQTLWLEEVNPELRILDGLTGFFLSQLGHASADQKREIIALSEVQT